MKPTDEDEFGFDPNSTIYHAPAPGAGFTEEEEEMPVYRIDPPRTNAGTPPDLGTSLVLSLARSGFYPDEIREMLSQTSLEGTGEALLTSWERLREAERSREAEQLRGEVDRTMEAFRDFSARAQQRQDVINMMDRSPPPVASADPTADLLEEKHTTKRRNLDI